MLVIMLQAPKYVFIINGTPVPVVRDETVNKIESNNLTLKDILEEAKYFLANGESLIAIKGVLEAMLPFMSVELAEYWDDLRNKIGLLEKGFSAKDVGIRLDSKRLEFKNVVGKNILELVKPKQRQTEYGYVYSIELTILGEGHVGWCTESLDLPR